jgi:Fur family ferric uptake transcriptional regulator
VPTPPVTQAPSARRHRSRQRDRVLAWLRATDSHPTAAQIHRGLLAEMPALSLGTVYRNLAVLVAEGEVEEIARAGGAARYDAKLEPHHHFRCDACGRIVDVEIAAPRGLLRRLADAHGLRARRVRMAFDGLCPECEAAPGGTSAEAPK